MQAAQVNRNIGRILAGMGEGPENVLKVNGLSIDRDAVTEARLAFFGRYPPPHAAIIVDGLGLPRF